MQFPASERLSWAETGACLYLLAPLLAFFLLFVSIPFAVITCGFVGFAIWEMGRRTDWSGILVSIRMNIGIAVLAATWLLLSGFFGGLAQSSDWIKHYAILNFLARNPDGLYVSSGNEILRYSIGWYLMPSLALHYTNVHWQTLIGSLWSFLGLFLFFRLLVDQCGGTPRDLLAPVVFALFSGVDILGSQLTGFHQGPPGHLEWWAGWVEYASSTTSLAWVHQHPAVVCFGWGNVGKVAEALRQRDASARLVLVPDVCMEKSAAEIAQALGAAVAYMPQGEENNFDANDLAQRDGADVLAELLGAAREPAKPAQRYKLLGADELRNLPPLAWRVRGVLPAVGLAALYGPSASGKSFLAFDMAAAIAEGRRWFDCRVEAAPVVYAALEGEAGFKLRAQAWEASRGRALPNGLRMMLQPFKLTEPQDVIDLGAVVPAGAVVVLDTLNRAAPTADENSSRDMGEILEAAKTLQAACNGLVLLVHHTGKNAAAGLRGHSSLFAAMDAAIEVSREGDRREWKVAKSKDGMDGEAFPFKLQVQTLGVEATGEAITSCVVMRDTAVEDVKRVKLPQGGNQKIVLTALRTLFKDGTTGKPGAPPLAKCVEIEAAVTFAASALLVAPDRKAERAREAITGLVARGVLGCNEGWIWMA
ncbi:AAA family ATPase [Alicycliphilus denitrificans]|uniref:AAA family ATPase n=1 Tax=Alicycliphilus denitrificans TaxID=179636 RepID=UPI003A80500E